MRFFAFLALVLPVLAGGCATDVPSRAEIRALQSEVRAVRQENFRLDRRVAELEADQTVTAAAAAHPAGSPALPSRGSEAVPALTVVKLKPRADPAPPLDTRTPIQEPDPALLEALSEARSAAVDAEAPSDVESEYAAGPEALRTGNVTVGIERLRQFAEAHPRHPRADDALYFAALGELGQQAPQRAAPLLEQVLQKYPAGDVVQDAMLKLAECRMRLRQTTEARALYAKVVHTYPGTPAASAAQVRLSSLQQRTP